MSQYVMEQAVTRGRIVDAPTAQVLSSLLMIYQFNQCCVFLLSLSSQIANNAVNLCCLMMLAEHVMCAQEEIRAQQKKVESAAQAEADAAAAAAAAIAAQEEVLDCLR